jgi:hypothetical protein
VVNGGITVEITVVFELTINRYIKIPQNTKNTGSVNACDTTRHGNNANVTHTNSPPTLLLPFIKI